MSGEAWKPAKKQNKQSLQKDPQVWWHQPQLLLRLVGTNWGTGDWAYGRIYREELLLNCGTSVSKTIHALPQGAANQSIKDAVLRNHSNLRTVSQRSNAYHQLHQKPDEALQSYNTRYASFFNLAYPELELDNPLSRMHCIHYASSLYGKLGDEMTGRFNQDLPENLQTAFEIATNFEPRIITKQSINSRKIHEVNHIDVGHEDEIEINEAHVQESQL